MLRCLSEEWNKECDASPLIEEVRSITGGHFWLLSDRTPVVLLFNDPQPWDGCADMLQQSQVLRFQGKEVYASSLIMRFGVIFKCLGKELKLHPVTLFHSFTVVCVGGIVNNKLYDLKMQPKLVLEQLGQQCSHTTSVSHCILHLESYIAQQNERNGRPKFKTKGEIEVQLEQVTAEPTATGAVRYFVISSEKQVLLTSMTLCVTSQKDEDQLGFKNMRNKFFCYFR